MSIFFATPCYGGKCDVQFTRAVAELRADLTVGNIPHDYLFTWNESLVQRARNNIATTFLETDWQKLMFIDSDIEFTTDDVAKLWNMDADIAVGLYPMKEQSNPLKPSLGAWINNKLVDVDELSGPTEVDYAGTGFMMIDRPVLETMKEECPHFVHEEGTSDGTRESFAWFNPRVYRNIYLSEDYAFCVDAKTRGFKIVADPEINLIHHGSFAYERPRSGH